MKYFFLIMAFFVTGAAFSQQRIKYVDSLKKIISKEIVHGADKNTIKKQVAYIKACEALGDHYKSIHQGKTALKYYLMAARLSDFTDSDLGFNELPIKLRDGVRIKVGDMYLSGKGIKKDQDSALYYHIRGLLLNKINRAAYYSQLYFKNTHPYFTDNKLRDNDSITAYPINPFYLYKSFSRTLKKDEFKNEMELLNKDTTLYCLLQASFGNIPKSMSGSFALNHFLDEIQKYFTKNIISPQRIISNVDFDSAPCVYKSFNLPCLQIIISKKKPFQ